MKFPLLFVAAMLLDVVYTTYSWSVATNRPIIAAFCSGALPLIGLLELVMITEAPTRRQKVIIGCITAAGFAAGTYLTLWLAPRS